MTHEKDRQDLVGHEEEMARNETFAYAVLNQGETELVGCLYVDPPGRTAPAGSDAQVSWWVVDAEASGALERAIEQILPGWFDETWGFRAVHYHP